jgi:hypothetical protein
METMMSKVPHTVDLSVKPLVTAFFDAPTNTVSYVVQDPNSNACAIIDSVMDMDYAAGRISYESADEIIAFVKEHDLSVEWLIETHVHADHLSGAPYLQGKLGGRIGIGENITGYDDQLVRTSLHQHCRHRPARRHRQGRAISKAHDDVWPLSGQTYHRRQLWAQVGDLPRLIDEGVLQTKRSGLQCEALACLPRLEPVFPVILLGHKNGNSGRACDVFGIFVILCLGLENHVKQARSQPGWQQRIAT